MKLANVDCTPMRFQPGDRILVRIRVSLSSGQKNDIRRIVEKWAGNMVEVLVIGPEMEVQVERFGGA